VHPGNWGKEEGPVHPGNRVGVGQEGEAQCSLGPGAQHPGLCQHAGAPLPLWETRGEVCTWRAPLWVFCLFETGSHQEARAGLEQPPECWDCRHAHRISITLGMSCLPAS
jgi:hypothetical protein